MLHEFCVAAWYQNDAHISAKKYGHLCGISWPGAVRASCWHRQELAASERRGSEQEYRSTVQTPRPEACGVEGVSREIDPQKGR